ncbi:MAG: hypothetical protein HUJ25_05745 [Crocinitomicaceae bacterium]|nr:hypothetical protein [Crocinitomicaceae bacterium]
MRIVVLVVSLILLGSCDSSSSQSSSENEKLERKLSLPDSLKEGLIFNYSVSEDFDHDDTSLFKPELNVSKSQDSLTITISFIESGSPSLEGGLKIDNKTLSLILLDIYPDEGCSCEEFYVTTFKIPKEIVGFNTVILERIYNQSVITDTLYQE